MNPTAPIKAAFNWRLVLTTAVVMVIIFAAAEKLGWTSYILSPFSAFKNRNAS